MIDQNVVDAARQQIDSYNVQIKLRDSAIRLSKVPEFKEIILDGFCTEKCAEYVRNSVDPATTVEGKAHSLAMAQAAGYLIQYLEAVTNMGNAAEYNKSRAEEELDGYMRGDYNE